MLVCSGERGKLVAAVQLPHSALAGVVPAMAAREHALNMPAVLHEVLKETFVLDLLGPLALFASCLACCAGHTFQSRMP